jgi:hypothetical protein
MDRDEVLRVLTEKIEAAGGRVVRSVKDLADEIGISTQRLYYLLKSFDQKGALVTRSRGPKGLEISLPGAVVPDGAAQPEVSERPRSRRPRRAEAPREGGERFFCPWCGERAERGWRFCVNCGERLPDTRTAQ